MAENMSENMADYANQPFLPFHHHTPTKSPLPNSDRFDTNNLMARRSKESFWTPDRLRDLLRRYPKHTPTQLMQHYGRTLDEIYRAYDFAVAHKRLLISQTKVKRSKSQRGYTVTTYAAGYAIGYVPEFLDETED